MMEKMNMIWCLKTQYEVNFSWEWILEIFSNYDLNHHYDLENKFDCVENNSIIIVSVNKEANTRLVEYIEKFNELNLNYSILHLSDEAFEQNIDFYSVSKKIIRNYYNQSYIDRFNILTIPLGYQSSVKKLDSNKTLYFNFVGQLKNDRVEMLNIFRKITQNYIYLTKQWGDPNGLNTQQYSQVLSTSLYTLCPRGWVILDSFRVNESLECGSIPVSILDYDGTDYFEKIYGLNPFIIGKDWSDAYNKVSQTNFKTKLEEIELWWPSFKERLRKKIDKFLKK